MGEFRTWLESVRQVDSIEEAQSLSRSSGLKTVGMRFDLINKALAHGRPISYDDSLPLASLEDVRGNIEKVLQMMGAFAQKMGVDAPETLEQAKALQIRDPEFKKMTPPIIIHNGKIIDGVSRVTAAKLLRVGEVRAFVIG